MTQKYKSKLIGWSRHKRGILNLKIKMKTYMMMLIIFMNLINQN